MLVPGEIPAQACKNHLLNSVLLAFSRALQNDLSHRGLFAIYQLGCKLKQRGYGSCGVVQNIPPQLAIEMPIHRVLYYH